MHLSSIQRNHLAQPTDIQGITKAPFSPCKSTAFTDQELCFCKVKAQLSQSKSTTLVFPTHNCQNFSHQKRPQKSHRPATQNHIKYHCRAMNALNCLTDNTLSENKPSLPKPRRGFPYLTPHYEQGELCGGKGSTL